MSETDIERERSALEAAIKRVEQEASIGQTQTAETVKPEQAKSASDTTAANEPAAAIQSVQQEPFIGQTQTAETAKTVSTQPQPAKETTASNGLGAEPAEGTTTSKGPSDILPAVLREIREDQAMSHPIRPGTKSARKAFVYINRLLLGVTCVISIAFASAIFVIGSGWFATHILDYLVATACAAVILCALSMLPIVQARGSKVALLSTVLFSSYLLGITTWLLGVLTTLQYWGMKGVVIGLCLGIVGVVPLGVAAATMSADWSMVAMMIVGALVTYGARDLALELADKETSSVKTAPSQ